MTGQDECDTTPVRPIRVLYVAQAGVLGGAAKSLFRLLETLDRTQVEPHIAAPPGGEVGALAEQLGVPQYPLPPCRLRLGRNPLHLWRQCWRFLHFCGRLKSVCREVRPDLVHANSLIAAWAATRATRAPVIWHVRDLKSPRLIMRLVRRRASRIIAISQAVAQRVQHEAPAGAVVQVIYNGLTARDWTVARSQDELRSEWGVGAETPLVGCMGQLISWKRQDLLLRALPGILRAVPGARLVFIGSDLFGDSGAYPGALRRLVGELDLEEAVIWVGQSPDPASALAALDVLAHPTENEPFGRVVLEALAVGTPVVAVNQAGPAEIIRDGESGLLVAPREVEALAEAITRVLQDRALAERLRAGGRKRAGDFSAAALTPEVVKLYHEVLDHCSRRRG